MAAEIEKLAQEYLQRGFPEVAEHLGNVAKMARNLGVPESFSVAKTPSPESPDKIRKFSVDQKEVLEKQGFVIYNLTGQSIKTLKGRGYKFSSTWHNDYPDFEALGSMRSEVAINPNRLFLPKSNNKTLAQQENMVNRFSEEIERKFQGVRAIIGQTADYVELAFVHYFATKECLFGEKENYDFARTKTPTSRSNVANVGDFRAGFGLHVVNWGRDSWNTSVNAAPLIVPV